MDSFRELPDEQIAQRALTEKVLFATLVTRYQDRLGRYLRRLGVPRTEDVEDLLQNIFLKAYRHLNGFRPQLKFSSWIYRIAHNEAVSFFRSTRVRPEVLPDMEDDALERIPAALETDQLAARGLDAARITKALSAIEPKYRDVLVLRYFEEREYAEISDVLKIPMGTVATYLNRGKKQLRAQLDHDTL